MEKILIVDDTVTNRFLLRTMLTAAKYSVAECENGAQCLAYCAKERPSLILLDLMMPVMDGFEACKRLREQYSQADLPIIIVTTREESEGLPEALRAGANDYVSKPVNREILLARVRSQLELRASHAETERLLEIQATTAEALPQALAIEAEDGSIVRSNHVWIEACGGRACTGIEESFKCMYGGALFAPVYQPLTESFAKSPEESVDHEYSLDGGPVRNVNLISRPIRTHGGERLRLWLIRDITRTRELERKINERVRLDSVGLLVKGVAHNFNNILGGVVGAMEILQKYIPEGDRAQRAMKIARQGAESAAALTRKLSLFTDLQVSDGTLRSEPLDEILEAVVIIWQERVGDRVTISLSTPRPLPRTKIRMAHLIELTNNILSNAIDAIPGTGKIEIMVEVPPQQDHLLLAIRDSGVGMDTDTVRRVFEPFFTTKNLDVRNSVGIDGHGLGLWSVYNLVKMAGGEVSVQSQAGKGTTVTVTLLTDEHDAAARQKNVE